MRILYIADPGSVGGAARALAEVVQEVTKYDIEPIVVTSVHDDFNRMLESQGIMTIASGHQSAMNTKSPYKWKRPLKFPYECTRYYFSLPSAINTIEKSVDMTTIDVIHTNSARNDIGCILTRKHSIPHVMHIREFGQEDFDCCMYRPNYYKYLNQNCSKFLAISKAISKSWISKGINADRVRVLYDGVDIEKIPVKEVYYKTGPLRIIIAGGVCEPKGQHIAVDAIGKLPESIREDVTLDIAGWPDPDYVKRLKNLIHEYGIEKQVNFLGTRNDLYAILRDYDIGLTCSKSEGFGRVTVEYMYAGLCAIGSDGGATPELIQNGKSGIIFRYPDSDELSDCIANCYKNRGLIQRYGDSGHKVAEWFSAKRNASEILDVYQELLR